MTMNQLRYAFKDDAKWVDLQSNDSLLYNIITSDFFEDEKNKGEMNIQALLLWGVLLCNGDDKTRSRVFYDIL